MAEQSSGHRLPPDMAEIKSEWAKKLQLLQGQYHNAQQNVESEGRKSKGFFEGVFGSGSTDARLRELDAAKAYNDFLESHKELEREATRAEKRLLNERLSPTERLQWEISRDQKRAMAGEFQLFLNEHGARHLHPLPVQTLAQTHFVDGTKQLRDSLWGDLGRLGVEASGLLEDVKQVLLKGPFTPEQDYKICKMGLEFHLGNKLNEMTPKLRNPYANFLLDDAKGRALEAADPVGAACRLLYPDKSSPKQWPDLGAVQTGDDPALGRADKAMLTQAMVVRLMDDPEVRAQRTPEQTQALLQLAQAEVSQSERHGGERASSGAAGAERLTESGVAQPSAEQLSLAQRFKDQLGDRLGHFGMGEQQIDTLAAAAVKEATRHAGQGEVSEFLLKKDGSAIALRQALAPTQEFDVRDALGQSAQAHWKAAQMVSNEGPVAAPERSARAV